MSIRGRSNKSAYDDYRAYLAGDLKLDKPRFRDVTELYYLSQMVLDWASRYYRRAYAIPRLPWPGEGGKLADVVAQDLLITRIRARNSLHSTLPDLAPEQIAYAEKVIANRRMDVSTLLDIPSYGPSVISLLADATRQGLSGTAAAEYVWRWGHDVPAAWKRDDERRARKQPAIDSKVKRRLTQVTGWHQTADLYIPWGAEVAGHHWQVRLNDFPDEYMYSLLIDGTVIGDFHEWPQAWDRGEPKPEVKQSEAAVAVRAAPDVDEATLLSRYQNGDCEAVWRDLMALGADVREARYKDAAWSVAQETMRRAAHNVTLLVDRLKQIDYRFHNDKDIYRPCSKKERKLLSAWERKRLWMPLSLRAFLEEVGWVDLLGTHPALNPVSDQGEPLFATDPLEIMGVWHLEELLEEWSSESPGDREPVFWEISVTAEAKIDILTGELAEDFYTVQVPNTAADAVLKGDSRKLSFVEYLRLSFRWGGFPGWEKYEKRPDKELAFLREGLLPL